MIVPMLASSISCALSATLIQRWSRYYSRALDRRSTPHHRARIRSYLYEGITKYKMTAVIEFIPILLHMSVFLFFAGLIEFLMPINNNIGWITFGAGIVGGLYHDHHFPRNMSSVPLQNASHRPHLDCVAVYAYYRRRQRG